MTAFADPLQRIRTGQIAQVPIITGTMEDDGTVFVYNRNESLSTYLAGLLGSRADLYPRLVRALYPGLNDSQVIAAVERDLMFRWCVHFLYNMRDDDNLPTCDQKSPAKLWSEAFVRSGIKSVYRYSYGALVVIISERQSTNQPMHIGAVFADLEHLPNLGAYHGSEGKLFIPRISYKCSGQSLFMTISYNNHAHDLSLRSAYSLWHI